MAQKTILNKEVSRKIRNYLNLLQKSGVSVERGILFGSQAKGTVKDYSDIDLCVVSSEFGKDPIAEEVRLKSLTWDIDPRIEVTLYSPADLACEEDPLAYEIRKYGREIRF
ncbi:MAG: nucleotidyltransferase domain-containing protein [Candidatus Cloacimonetes bacterium]|nr:nucleotidyltransferase domain-containing protein [Candidatus Cloacimonadota bacterium]